MQLGVIILLVVFLILGSGGAFIWLLSARFLHKGAKEIHAKHDVEAPLDAPELSEAALAGKLGAIKAWSIAGKLVGPLLALGVILFFALLIINSPMALSEVPRKVLLPAALSLAASVRLIERDKSAAKLYRKRPGEKHSIWAAKSFTA